MIKKAKHLKSFKRICTEAIVSENGYHVTFTASSKILFDKGRGAKNLQKECLCYVLYYIFYFHVEERFQPCRAF